MSDLNGVANLGPALIDELGRAGIQTLSGLLSLGSIGAGQRIRQTGAAVCANKLYALEGAVRGLRWHVIPAAERAALWQEFQATQNG